MFVDEAIIYLKAGNGGHGCVSFLRQRFRPKGGPDGGDGARGGSVILEGDENVQDLNAYRFQASYQAQNGEPGRGRSQHGRQGKDCVLHLPLGSVVYQHNTIEGSESDTVSVADLTDHGQRVALLKGGEGGWGNQRFKNAVNQAPRTFYPGEEGASGAYRVVLKTLADVGLVGFPNAGKSSLLNYCTAARPRIAPYAFTTLNPIVGIIEDKQSFRRISLADIPGLIEGASENKGLGHRFLRHIERCKLLLFLLDMSGSEDRCPSKDYQDLLYELSCYNPVLLEKPHLVAANKMDEPSAQKHLRHFRSLFPDITLFPISCLKSFGIDSLKAALFSHSLDPPNPLPTIHQQCQKFL